MVLTWIIEGPITPDTAMIVKALIPGTICSACTMSQKTIVVDPLLVSQWSQPLHAIHGPHPTPQSAPITAPAAIHTTASTTTSATPYSVNSVGPQTQGLHAPPTHPPLGFNFPISPQHFEALDPPYPSPHHQIVYSLLLQLQGSMTIMPRRIILDPTLPPPRSFPHPTLVYFTQTLPLQSSLRLLGR